MATKDERRLSATLAGVAAFLLAAVALLTIRAVQFSGGPWWTIAPPFALVPVIPAVALAWAWRQRAS